MFESLWQTVEQVISGAAAADAVAAISRFHRIQASPGYRRAAEWVLEELARCGLEARILAYPANRSDTFWSHASFQEWEARQATLHLSAPADEARKLADYRDLPLHLVGRSLSFDGVAELVALEKGEEAPDYDGIDVRGKVVLTKASVQRVHDLAVTRRGAVGLIYDGMTEIEPVRRPWTLPDAVQYTSFWWRGRAPQGFGFALSPRQGEALRRRAQENTLQVRARVDARLYDGALEVVEAVLPGSTDQEIVLVAHLCHPQPSANDNASGAAALLEVARGLAALVSRGELATPRRTIRFLWVPEMYGAFAYLASCEDRIPRMVAGLNLDMVGQDQEQCGCALVFEQPPHAAANFAGALLARLRRHLLPEVETHGGMGGFPLFRFADTPFSGGSDHYIFTDPTVGVPMPMIIQWPDRFYHTSADTPDRVDPRMLERVGGLSAVYAYWLAQAGEAEVRWLAREVSARFRRQVVSEVQDAVTGADEEGALGQTQLQQQMAYHVARQKEALDSVRRLAEVDVSPWQKGDAAFADSELNAVAGLLPDRPAPQQESVDGSGLVPKRRFRGPADVDSAVARLDESARERWWELQQRIKKTARILPTLAEYWADGRRSVAEIGTLLQHETGRQDTALLVDYFSMLADLGLVEVR